MIVTYMFNNPKQYVYEVQKVQKVHVFSLSLYINSGLVGKKRILRRFACVNAC